ncbi:DUF1501 domain-containing protein [Gimesia algae]|uniref:DUF1501 domain-containing protein n=1 Tax=Gimesia algae TaxID=2527971 RepID=A0A517VIA7_9PLAN|nr:DUF1501 domain-containing protein [Gimesia algae]QDT92717.1 hypothetical protein Pan161_43870 [Gimesia algae]
MKQQLKRRQASQRPTGASRREFMRIGLGGFSSLSLPGLYQLQAAAESQGKTPEKPKKERTAVILVWCRGGVSHLDTYDPKPDAASDYRGPFSPIATNTEGLLLSELLPRHAQISDKFTILRSITHTGGGHPAGSLQVLGGDPDRIDKRKPKLPDFMSVANFLRRDSNNALPNYVGINAITNYDSFQIAGPTYLGPGAGPFQIGGDPSAPDFKVPNIGLTDTKQTERLAQRISLRQQFDQYRRDLDLDGSMEAMNQFEAQATNLLTSKQAADAFDLSREPEHIRERYGMHQWGQQCLMARRLVEAGVEIITTELSGKLCGRVRNWDDHAVNHHVFDAIKYRMPFYDQAVTALIEDIYQRGLNKRVLVVVAGEFGRTPRISYSKSTGGGIGSGSAGTTQPGRDHWPNANSMLFAGGNIQTGQIIGATDGKGEGPIERAVGPHDFLATIYSHLGIDYANTFLPDFSGRPTPIVMHGNAIPELTGRG